MGRLLKEGFHLRSSNYAGQVDRGVGPALTSIAQADMNAFMETWLPALHKDYVEKYKAKRITLISNCSHPADRQ